MNIKSLLFLCFKIWQHFTNVMVNYYYNKASKGLVERVMHMTYMKLFINTKSYIINIVIVWLNFKKLCSFIKLHFVSSWEIRLHFKAFHLNTASILQTRKSCAISVHLNKSLCVL